MPSIPFPSLLFNGVDFAQKHTTVSSLVENLDPVVLMWEHLLNLWRGMWTKLRRYLDNTAVRMLCVLLQIPRKLHTSVYTNVNLSNYYNTFLEWLVAVNALCTFKLVLYPTEKAFCSSYICILTLYLKNFWTFCSVRYVKIVREGFLVCTVF